MFGKLVKYEMRHLIRIFGPMWAIVLSLCVLCRILIRPDEQGFMMAEGNAAILPIVAVFLAVFGIMTMMIVATIVLLQRFYKGMYGDEGYLMFTLPVTAGQLINAKALCAFLLMLATELVTILGVLIMLSYPALWREALGSLGMSFRDFLQMALEMNGIAANEAWVLLIWGIFAGMLETAKGIYLVYLAISLGQLWKKHPVAGAIAAYYVVMLVIGGVQMFATDMLGLSAYEMMVGNATLSASSFEMLAYSCGEALVFGGLAFVGTKLILDKKLNIQ